MHKEKEAQNDKAIYNRVHIDEVTKLEKKLLFYCAFFPPKSPLSALLRITIWLLEVCM